MSQNYVNEQDVLEVLIGMWRSVRVYKVGSLAIFIPEVEGTVTGNFPPLLYDYHRGFEPLGNHLRGDEWIKNADEWRKLASRLRSAADQYETLNRLFRGKFIREGMPSSDISEKESLRQIGSFFSQKSIWTRGIPESGIPVEIDLRKVFGILLEDKIMDYKRQGSFRFEFSHDTLHVTCDLRSEFYQTTYDFKVPE